VADLRYARVIEQVDGGNIERALGILRQGGVIAVEMSP
jgi:hypothetical protein